MTDVKPHSTLEHHEPHSSLEANEKGNVYGINDVDSSQASNPGGVDYEDLPDPDAGKSDEERARLV